MSRSTSSLSIVSQQIVVTVLGAFLFQTIIPINSFRCAARKLPENVPIFNQTGEVRVWAWNTTNPYSPLSDFRNESVRKFYTVWPEDIPGHSFRYPCEDRASKLMLENFTYPSSGGLIQRVQYFDLGIVEHYQPYWVRPKPCHECWSWSKPPGWTPIFCERRDVVNLYSSRALSTVFKGLRFGVIMVLIQQVAFVVLAILIHVYYLNRNQGFHKICALITKGAMPQLQCLNNWGSTSVNGLHLLALAVAGFLFVEGYGHTGDWRTSSMNTLAYYYRVQTACAFVASFLGQCADSMKSCPHFTVQSGNNLQDKSHIEMLIGQVVVCVLMVEYLYLTDDEHQNFMIQVVFGVVTVAVTLSMVTVIAVGGSSLGSIVKALWTSLDNHLKNEKLRRSNSRRKSTSAGIVLQPLGAPTSMQSPSSTPSAATMIQPSRIVPIVESSPMSQVHVTRSGRHATRFVNS